MCQYVIQYYTFVFSDGSVMWHCINIFEMYDCARTVINPCHAPPLSYYRVSAQYQFRAHLNIVNAATHIIGY